MVTGLLVILVNNRIQFVIFRMLMPCTLLQKFLAVVDLHVIDDKSNGIFKVHKALVMSYCYIDIVQEVDY